MENQYILPIRKAAEEIGVPDLETLRKAAKKFGALIIVAGLEYVDRTRFDDGVKSEVQAKAEQAERRAKTKGTVGRSIGLLRARIERAPGLIAAKEGVINAVRKQVDEAENAYEKKRAKKTLKDLENGLKKQKANLEKDQADLEKILNEEDEE